MKFNKYERKVLYSMKIDFKLLITTVLAILIASILTPYIKSAMGMAGGDTSADTDTFVDEEYQNQ